MPITAGPFYPLQSAMQQSPVQGAAMQMYNNQLFQDAAAVQYENNLNLMNQANAFSAEQAQLNRDFRQDNLT